MAINCWMLAVCRWFLYLFSFFGHTKPFREVLEFRTYRGGGRELTGLFIAGTKYFIPWITWRIHWLKNHNDIQSTRQNRRSSSYPGRRPEVEGGWGNDHQQHVNKSHSIPEKSLNYCPPDSQPMPVNSLTYVSPSMKYFVCKYFRWLQRVNS